MSQKKDIEFLNTSGKKISLVVSLSKLGICSRNRSRELIFEGKVTVNGVICSDPHYFVDLLHDIIKIEDQDSIPKELVYIMLNKPRGLVTSASDEYSRETVYSCLKDISTPCVFAVGRLDKESEGLLLFSNDTTWSSKIQAPSSHLEKEYHVKVDCIPNPELLEKMLSGVQLTPNENLHVNHVEIIRHGEKNCWLAITLNEGKNRHIRRLLRALGINTTRLVRVRIGSLNLGDLKKGQYRILSVDEIQALS